MARRFTNLRKKIEYILATYPKSRNSDTWLTLKLWTEYYPSRIDRTFGRAKIALDDIMLLPTEDACKRIRAIIQNTENKFLPTSWEVAKQRKINEEKWLKFIRENK